MLTGTLLVASAVATVRCARPPVRGGVPLEPIVAAAPATDGTLRPAPGALDALLAAVDRDGDRRITVLDQADFAFDLPLAGGGAYRVTGVTLLANLVQELTLAERAGSAEIRVDRITENPVDRLSRLIRERYWDALTRRIDAASLDTVLPDEKLDGRRRPAHEYTGELAGCTGTHDPARVPWFLWVSPADPAAWEQGVALARQHPRLIVCRLPERVTPEWVAALDGGGERGSRHGLLALGRGPQGPLPYVVPGGRFNELYGWDSYFHVLGLVADGRLELARAVVDNLAYEVRHYGQILNANRTYYLTRSQPPFLSSMLRAVHAQDPSPEGRGWVRGLLATVIEEYERVWTSGPRRTEVCREGTCLSRYHGAAVGPPPEVEPGHFDWLYAPRARAAGLSVDEVEARYRARALPAAELGALDAAFAHDRCMRESGHDTTYRWFDPTTGEDRCADFATVDLNALLLKAELDVAFLLERVAGGALERDRCAGGGPCRETLAAWCARARRRLALLRERLWDDERALYSDLDLRTGKPSGFVSATAFYPLWAVGENACDLGLFEDERRVDRLVVTLLRELEQPGGLAATARPATARSPARQWEHPNGWAPHQILAWTALRQHGFTADADRLTWRWLSTIVENARDYHGTVPEKLDVVARSHRVYAEYGNVATDFAYITPEGFGWMNASFELGLAALAPDLRDRLRAAAASDADLPMVP